MQKSFYLGKGFSIFTSELYALVIGLVIPELKVQKSFYLGKGFSIFTSELYAILIALSYICNIQLAIYNFVICVDSKSVLLH